MKGLKSTNQFINSTRHFFHVSEFLSYSKKKQLRKDKQRMNIVVWSYCSKRLLCGIHCSRFPYVILWTNLMMVQNSKGKVSQIYT